MLKRKAVLALMIALLSVIGLSASDKDCACTPKNKAPDCACTPQTKAPGCACAHETKAAGCACTPENKAPGCACAHDVSTQPN